MVKCTDCGFLSARNIKTRQLEEAEHLFRDVGSPVQIGPDKIYPPHFVHELMPYCGTNEYDLITEMETAQEHPINRGINNTEVLSVIRKERDCGGYTKWFPGFSPKEHSEMRDRQEWQEWQEKQRKEDKRWRIIELVVLVILTLVVAGGFTLLGAFIERGSLFPSVGDTPVIEEPKLESHIPDSQTQ